jgi:hypothetical protein
MRRIAVLALAGGMAAAGSARGEQSLLEGEHGRLALGGYALTLGGLQALRFELAPGAPDPPPADHLGLSANVLRLEWTADLGQHVTAEVHQRAFLRMSSEPLAGQQLGLGASAVPRRTLDLRTTAYDEERLLLEHDFDRLAVHAGLGDFDVTLGRQAITWGFATLFPVADLWTTLSPFELDTSQKRGIDALRLLYSHSRSLELEGVVADRGSLRDLSAGLRAVTSFSAVDLYLAFAKQWRELVAFGGAGVVLGSFKLRAEAVTPYDLDGDELARPRGAAGLDWFHRQLTVSLEAHYNGTGAAHAADYVTHLATSPAFARGESYFLGRWYAGAAATWKLVELFQFAVTVLGNMQDPSAVCAASLTYWLAQEASLSLGAFQGVGRIPIVAATPELRSEFGALGGLYYLALSAFF